MKRTDRDHCGSQSASVTPAHHSQRYSQYLMRAGFIHDRRKSMWQSQNLPDRPCTLACDRLQFVFEAAARSRARASGSATSDRRKTVLY